MTTPFQSSNFFLIPIKYSSEKKAEEAHESTESMYFLKLSLQYNNYSNGPLTDMGREI